MSDIDISRLNLEFYRKQAKALLKSGTLGPDAALNGAQRTIAHRNGFASWPRFKVFIEQSRLDFQGLADTFIAAALSDGRRAQEMLDAHPALATAGVYAALVLGDVEAVTAAIADDPGFVTSKSGPQNAEPIVYACFSRFGAWDQPRIDAITETVRILLAVGANPDTALPEEEDRGRLSCLYGAAGLLHNVPLTRLLLEAGADPNDNESLYHATETRDLTCLKLLLEHGARVNGTNALKHMLDWESPEGVRLLLAAGGDPNETNPEGDTALHWAVRRGRSAGVVRQLLDAGADINAVRKDGRNAYALAAFTGNDAVAALLAEHGADTRLGPLEAFVAGQGALPADAPLASYGRLMTHLAESGNQRAVEALLKAGVPVDARGDGNQTALHYACWRGNVGLIRLLLDHGAAIDIDDTMYHASPAGYLHHGATNCGEGDYAEGARLMINAGATWDTPSGNPAMDAVLRQHGLIN